MTEKIQKIKEEIERRMNNLWYLIPEGEKVLKDDFTKDDANNLGKYTALESLLKFIDSLPEEHTSEDLEEEINHISKNEYFNFLDWKSIARHFAEWQKEKDYKMYAHVPLKDIHDAWQELKKNKSDIENYPSVCFQKGADWRENQMKEALQTEYEKGRFDMREEIIKDTVDATILDIDAQTIELGLWPEKLLNIKEGDKVKIVIIKSEQQ